jgi:hypothetical protein
MARPRGKSLEQEAKAQVKRKPPRKRLSAAEQVKRNRELVHDRLVNDLSWSALALKHNISERMCRKVMSGWRRENAGSIDAVDATGELWETLQGFEAQIERLRELRVKAENGKNWNVVLGAERQMTTVRQAKLALLQEAELIPKNLGTFKHVFEVRHVVERVLFVLDRIERGEIKPAEAKPELLALLGEEPAGDPTQN